MFWKNQCLAIFCILGWTVSHEKILIQFKDRRKFSIFVKPEVSSIAHASWSDNRQREVIFSH